MLLSIINWLPSSLLLWCFQQVAILQRGRENRTHSNKFELESLLRDLASSDNPGATITTLQAEPFKGINGEVRGGDRLQTTHAYHSSCCVALPCPALPCPAASSS